MDLFTAEVILKGRSEDDIVSDVVILKEHGLSQGSGKPFHQLSSLLPVQLRKNDTKNLMIIDIKLTFQDILQCRTASQACKFESNV